ncbi:hypothetical protein GEU84_019585 [Fertoebacter nigrum]|uniref:Acyltransferase n=1 Tax=Fertoeibacter niger TaxID=2656921 RepID=A0A8X8GYH0_9RHOB|nr:hypothetical protein [Fertoeibacter niger]NUB46599.1 hypothetical protein [Fertoeibacter niger]
MQADRLSELIEKFGVDLDVGRNYMPVGESDFLNSAKFEVTGGAGIFASGRFVARNLEVTLSGKGSAIFIAEGVNLYRTKFEIRGENNVVFIGPNARVKSVLFTTHGLGNTIALGGRVTWESGSAICGPGDQAILIGNGCMFSNSVMLRTDDGHGIFDRKSRERLNTPASVVIDRYVWLGNGSRCNKGVRIHEGTVLGGASIASGTLDAHCVYAGIPARKKRENIVWSRTGSYEDVPPVLLNEDEKPG